MKKCQEARVLSVCRRRRLASGLENRLGEMDGACGQMLLSEPTLLSLPRILSRFFALASHFTHIVYILLLFLPQSCLSRSLTHPLSSSSSSLLFSAFGKVEIPPTV